VAAVAAWCLVLRAFVFDSWGAALAWSPVLLLLLIPGIVLAGFARRAARLAGLRERVSREIAGLVESARADIGGAAGLRGLLGALGDLREHGEEGRRVAAAVVGTARVVNPAYLGMVALAALGAVFVVLLAVAGLVSLAF
jgi:hypothetical protein